MGNKKKRGKRIAEQRARQEDALRRKRWSEISKHGGRWRDYVGESGKLPVLKPTPAQEPVAPPRAKNPYVGFRIDPTQVQRDIEYGGVWGEPNRLPFMPPLPGLSPIESPMMMGQMNPLLPAQVQGVGNNPMTMFQPMPQTQYPNYTPAGVMDWGNLFGGLK